MSVPTLRPTPVPSASFRPTPVPSASAPTTSTAIPISSTSLSSVLSTGQLSNSSATFPSVSSTTGPSPAPTLGPPTPGPSTTPGLLLTSTVANGIFGAGANYDALIIFAMVVGGLAILILLGAMIYCCCYYCGGMPTRHYPTISRTASLRSIRQDNYGRDVIVTRRPSIQEERPVIVRTVSRKRYLYPADVMGVGNDVSYNTIRPKIMTRNAPVITTLGDGYAMGHSLRSSGNRYGGRNLLFYEDAPSPQIITLY